MAGTAPSLEAWLTGTGCSALLGPLQTLGVREAKDICYLGKGDVENLFEKNGVAVVPRNKVCNPPPPTPPLFFVPFASRARVAISHMGVAARSSKASWNYSIEYSRLSRRRSSRKRVLRSKHGRVRK
jgi:hypothetical protein